eukprot:ctg_2276.g364
MDSDEESQRRRRTMFVTGFAAFGEAFRGPRGADGEGAHLGRVGEPGGDTATFADMALGRQCAAGGAAAVSVLGR